MAQTPNDTFSDQPEQPQEETYYHYPGQDQPPSEGGAGCWLIGLLTFVIAAILIIAGLFLPPISLGDRLFSDQASYAQFDPQAAAPGSLLAVEESGLTLLVDPTHLTDRFGVALSTVPGESLLNGNGGSGWVQAARVARPVYLLPQSSVYSIETDGSQPDQITLTVAVPSDAAAIDILDLYEWDETRNEWSFVPSHPTTDGTAIRADLQHIPQHLALFQTTPINAGGEPTLMTILDVGDAVSGDTLNLMDIVSPTGRQAGIIPATASEPARATLVGLLAPGYQTNSIYDVMPVVRNFTDPRATDADTITEIISEPALRNQHIQQLVDFAVTNQFQGLFIDYRDLPVEQQNNFSLFIQQLASRLDALDIKLGVIIPAAEGVVVGSDSAETTNAEWQTGGYDWRAIGHAADYVVINFALDPRQFTPGNGQLIEEMMSWAIGEISRYKILGGLTARSIQQRNGTFTPIGFDEALSPLGNVKLETNLSETGTVIPGSEIHLSLDGFSATPGTDATIQTPYIAYSDVSGAETSRMWLTTREALQFRMDQLGSYGILGIAFNDLLTPGVADDIHTALNTTDEATGQSELLLNWHIESAAGQVAQINARLNEEVVVTLDAEEGNYAVNVDVVSGGASSSRGGAQVALALSTATPTPRPTATATPTPTVTPTLPPVQANPVPSNQQTNNTGSSSITNSGPPVTNPGAGSIGALEIGGHVTGTGSSRAQDAMRAARMNWMKVQVRFVRGSSDVSGAAGEIERAHAAGFKILLGVVGNPAELAADGESYMQQYGEFVARLATLGPDAIEVWNEPNIAREWPEGQINGSNYTTLLRYAWNGIKNANGGVMVISAALAPTGAEPAFPGKVVNDDNFLRQMVAAGALNFMDCVGMHYNEGIVSAYATSGDPRDNYYTRYLPTMINYYWDIVGGNRRICITEIGYLSPEGYGSLPDFFAWAAGNTVSEQAAWLAEAAAFSSQSGKVRLMIVWNVDFQNYGADPMAGYAMIRPGGGCPACNALAGAR